MNHRSRWLVALFAVGVFVATVRAETPIDFNRQIKPILSNTCFRCHGPDVDERKGGTDGLRLDLVEGATADLGGYAAVVPGKPEASEVIKRMTSTDPDSVMPPPSLGKQLTPAEVKLVTEWIRQGAKYSRHWSYTKPVRPELPAVKQAAWPRNEIDRFLLARLEREKLAPSPEADPYALMRRVTLDLTGLPPTLAQLDEFEKSIPKSPGPQVPSSATKDLETGGRGDWGKAYEAYVDRLLASPQYGEHWAHMWLDLARYADSAGYADDKARTIWLFRDYVIQSLNANKPFDQFTIEQIAGDLLPKPTQDQLIATAFHRNTLTNNEGGTNDEEFRNVAVVDRVNTTMAVWMGTTIACAQCHNHKYDPISQEEFFRFFAIFNNTEDADRGDESPLLSFYTAEQEKSRATWQAELAKLEPTLKTPTDETRAGQARWEAKFPRDVNWGVLWPDSAKSQEGMKTIVSEDGSIHVPTGAKNDTYTIETHTSLVTPKPIRAISLEVLPDDALPGKGPGHAAGNFILSKISATLRPAGSDPGKNEKPLEFSLAVADYSQAGFEAESALNNKDAKTKGWAVGGQTSQMHTLVLVLKTPLEAEDGSILTVTLAHQATTANQTLGHFRLMATTDEQAAEIGRTPRPVVAALRVAADQRTPEQKSILEQHYLGIASELEPARKKIAELKKQLADTQQVSVPIMRDLADKSRRKTQIQHRGNFLDLGKEVTEGTPAVFPSLPEGPVNRMALARWLIDENNPLTGRVIANRYWEQIFGIGIVSTSEEFGAQGDLPFHPELLDWLATELVRLRWDMKAFVKLLVTSTAYRQTSKVTSEMMASDPDNRLLARGPRFRLSAEMVRDQALAVSGLLSAKMLGPPVKPPQPQIGLNAAFGAVIDWQTSAGEDKYRRALYTNWRRSNPYPSMATFDAPNREVCTVRRGRTNTPLQALVTLNDPVYIEAAQALARRIVAEGGSNPADRARYAFRVCLSRPPHEEELGRLVRLYEQAFARYEKNPDQAKQMATEPLGAAPQDANLAQLAAWTVVGNVLMNLDEMLMKR